VTSAADARKPFTLGGKRRAQRPDQTGRRTQNVSVPWSRSRRRVMSGHLRCWCQTRV
jgi:hypothetical protein